MEEGVFAGRAWPATCTAATKSAAAMRTWRRILVFTLRFSSLDGSRSWILHFRDAEPQSRRVFTFASRRLCVGQLRTSHLRTE